MPKPWPLSSRTSALSSTSLGLQKPLSELPSHPGSHKPRVNSSKQKQILAQRIPHVPEAASRERTTANKSKFSRSASQKARPRTQRYSKKVTDATCAGQLLIPQQQKQTADHNQSVRWHDGVKHSGIKYLKTARMQVSPFKNLISAQAARSQQHPHSKQHKRWASMKWACTCNLAKIHTLDHAPRNHHQSKVCKGTNNTDAGSATPNANLSG